MLQIPLLFVFSWGLAGADGQCLPLHKICGKDFPILICSVDEYGKVRYNSNHKYETVVQLVVNFKSRLLGEILCFIPLARWPGS